MDVRPRKMWNALFSGSFAVNVGDVAFGDVVVEAHCSIWFTLAVIINSSLFLGWRIFIGTWWLCPGAVNSSAIWSPLVRMQFLSESGGSGNVITPFFFRQTLSVYFSSKRKPPYILTICCLETSFYITLPLSLYVTLSIPINLSCGRF